MLNNRVIKFRAWYPKYNQMVYSSELFTNIGDLFSFSAGNDNGATIMQYTGVKDKNGCEIYESDFVKVKKPNSYLSGTYEVYWDNNFAMFAMRHFPNGKPAVKGNRQPYILNQRDIEVIGNIYEELNDTA